MTDPQAVAAPWTAHDYITRAYERTASIDAMIAKLHEYGYEIRPIRSRGATPSEPLRAALERLRDLLVNPVVIRPVDEDGAQHAPVEVCNVCGHHSVRWPCETLKRIDAARAALQVSVSEATPHPATPDRWADLPRCSYCNEKGTHAPQCDAPASPPTAQPESPDHE